MEKVLTDCFWCGEAYELGVHNRCPKCSTDIDSKAAASGENEITFEI
jgi:hypothetical protein